jgi:sugar phosphate isomerase/epimerase
VMPSSIRRREFLKLSATIAAAGIVGPRASLFAVNDQKPLFEISLAEWSLHRTIFSGKLDNLDFAKAAKQDYGINAIEFVNQFFKDKAKNIDYLTELKKRADGEGVKMLLIMCDGEGALGDADEKKRQTAVENHFKWVEAARFLGCHAIRVNAQSSGSYEEQVERAADGLRKLTEFGAKHDISVIVENHGGLSSNGEWLAKVIKTVNLPRCGTLPDFGNFAIDRKNNVWYDRYKGVAELMPFAKAVSAKSHDFDDAGNETSTDYAKMMKIVLDAGYHGYVGIEYEGSKLSEPDGIKATKKLLEKVRDELSKG